MNQLIKMDEEYRKWIEDIGKRYKQRQIKASVSVNQEMIGFYWSIGSNGVQGVQTRLKRKDRFESK